MLNTVKSVGILLVYKFIVCIYIYTYIYILYISYTYIYTNSIKVHFVWFLKKCPIFPVGDGLSKLYFTLIPEMLVKKLFGFVRLIVHLIPKLTLINFCL